jgi:hypothetical protein
MNNIITLPRPPSFSLLDRCSDGYFVLFSDGHGAAVEVIGPFPHCF